MVKLNIDKDENYPVYSIRDKDSLFTTVIDVPIEMEDRIRYIIEEFNKIQDYIDFMMG